MASFHEADVAVVGAGAAGLYAALCAAREHATVALVSATPLARTASYWAQGGLAAALKFHSQASAAQRRVLSWVTTSGHTGTPRFALVCLHYCKASSVGAFCH